jgi:DNA-binding MarR family transcriptional regulator
MLHLQQVTPAAERAWITLHRVAPSLLERVEQALRIAGFPPLAWYDVLWELERNDARLRQRDLGRRLLVARYNLSRLLDRLQEAGLIKRADCEGDARGQVITLTRAGMSLRTRMWPVYAAAIRDSVEEKLTGAEAAMLAKLLDKLS